VAVKYRRDDSTVEEAEAVIVLGTRCERRHCAVTVLIATEMESIGIGVSTPVAGEVGK
jgi:hypothetical protein